MIVTLKKKNEKNTNNVIEKTAIGLQPLSLAHELIASQNIVPNCCRRGSG